MKLLRLRIENFGKLSEFELNFDKNITVITEDNGWGKTTLTDFIKTMFYGLSGDSKRTDTENYRRRYNPWQGGVFGGYLEFEFKGKGYRITRIFKERNGQDIFELMDLETNKNIDHYPNTKTKITDKGKMLGYYLLGLNEDAFDRTVFLSQNSGTHELSSVDINEKLSNLLGGSKDEYDFEKTIKRIKDKKSKLKNNVKTGEINKLETEIINTEKEIEQSKNDRLQMNQNYEDIKNLNEGVREKTKKLTNIKTKIDILNKNSEFTTTQKNLQEAEKRLETIKQNIKDIEKFFNNNQPNKEEIYKINSLIDRVTFEKENNKLQSKLSSLKSELTEIEKFFDKKIPTEKEVLQLQEDIFSYNANKNKNTTSADKNTSRNKLYFVAILDFVVLMTIGLLVYVLVNKTVGVSMFVSFAVLYIAKYAYMYIKNKNKHKTSNNFTKLDGNNEKILKQKIENYLGLFFISLESEDNYTQLLNEINSNLNRYNNIINSITLTEKEIDEHNKSIQNINLEIEGLIENYKVDDIENYTNVKQKINSQLQNYNSELRMLSEREQDYKNLTEKLKLIKNSLKSLPDEDVESLIKQQKELDLQMGELQKEITKLKTLNISLENSSSRLPVLETELDEINSKISELNYEYRVLNKTEKYLSEAEKRVASKYIAPIKDVFDEFASKIFKDNLQEVTIDSDLKIKLQNYGRNYGSELYSEGYKDIINIIMRLSLTKVLFDGAKPFVVLDDPFTNSDPTKLEKALDVLKELSNDFQVVYLTCHPSRAV